MDISNIPLVDLKELLHKIPAEIRRREKDEKAKLLKELETLATERGFTLNDLLDAPVSPAKTKNPVAPKYRHPSDASLTWTGRGRQPKWVVALTSQGTTLDALAI